MERKKKLLILSDDIRFQTSGVSSMAFNLIVGMSDKYDFVNIGGSIKHPDAGKLFDISEAIKNEFNKPTANVKVIPVDGYGDAELVKRVIKTEQIDAVIHFTDPRFWGWLYAIEREIRQTVPLLYYTIWDDTPYPMWNKPYYLSCDGLFCISKQTKNIVENVLGNENYTSLNTIETSACKRLVTYVPHGVNADIFYPLDANDENVKTELNAMRQELFCDKKYDFILLYNNRNIRRKKTADCILAYKLFCDTLTPEQAKRCVFLMHTHGRDENGTDLFEVKRMLCPNYDIVFTDGKKFQPQKLNMMYNLADLTINLADNEGWGLATTESVMAGTPFIATVTGGLQDQMGFVDDSGNEYEFTPTYPSNHTGFHKKHGEWMTPIWPVCKTLQGSIPTPYIFADHVKYEDAAVAIRMWYDLGRTERKRRGLVGREWGLSDKLTHTNMCDKFIESTEAVFTHWQKRTRFDLFNVDINYHNAPSEMGVLSFK